MKSAAEHVRSRFASLVRRAFGEFLALPFGVLLVFVALAALLYWLDDVSWSTSRPGAGSNLLERFFGDAQAMSSLLSTVASSMITVTSITFSLLLVAVQQGASALTSQVFDQFLRRRWNQFYFGFFVGLSTFVLITLVTVSSFHRPILATLVALVMTAAALCMMVVLIYNTVDQMRPGEIVRTIHRFVLAARARELDLLARTRRSPDTARRSVAAILSDGNGVVTAIAIDGLRDAAGDEAELDLQVVIGSTVAFRSTLCLVRARQPLTPEREAGFADRVRQAIRLEHGRDLACDAAYGIEQLATIGWTSMSTAKSNPQPGILVCRALTDILSRWSDAGPVPEDPSSPVVYHDDVVGAAVRALESLVVVASESIQHQSLAEIVRSLAFLLGRLPAAAATEIEGVALRSLSTLGEHVPTRELDRAHRALAEALVAAGFAETAGRVEAARVGLAQSSGHLNSRSTRVPDA